MKPVTLLVASAVAAVLSLTGCGTDSASSESPAAEESTTQAATPGTEVDADELAAHLSEGVHSYDTFHTEVTIRSSSDSIEFEGDVDISDPDNIKMSSVGTANGGTQHIVIVDGTQYVSMDDGQTWTESPATEDAVPFEEMNDYLDNVTKAVYDGTEEVNGTQASIYSLTIDVGDSSGPAEYKAWVDDQYRIVKYVIEDGADGAVEGIVSAFNEPVDITVPENA